MKLSAKAFITLVASLCLTGISSTSAWAQIYTCVDAKGRKLTSDRPIAECIDRDQKELNNNATVKRTVKPVMTAEEQRALDAKEKTATQEKIRITEEKRKDRALLIRYPNLDAYAKERTETLAQVDDLIKLATNHMGELASQRISINAEVELYKIDPSKTPFVLKRQVEDNDNNMAAQKRFVLDQESEKKRINMRFDEELVRLKTLWPLMGTVSIPGAEKK